MQPAALPQPPRFCLIPDYVSSAGDEAIELARMAGLELDPWQQMILAASLGERPDGKWAALEVGLTVPRQNGKGGTLEARELAGLYLLGEGLQVHSAHQFDTSLEAFRRLLMLIEETPDLERRVKRVSRSHGEEGIELLSGERIRFRTRTKGGGRGFSGDVVYLDEAMYISQASHGALMPTLSARPNPQLWYTGSAVDQWVHDHGVVFSRIRKRGIEGDSGLVYAEWSAHLAADGDDDPEAVTAELTRDEDAWAQANPGLGIRISREFVSAEQRSMDPRTFAVERLGIGDWPSVDAEGDQLIPMETWRALRDRKSKPLDPVTFAFDVTPDRAKGSIGVAGINEDGKIHVEVVEQREGTGWMVERVVELDRKHGPSSIICDPAGPAGSLIGPLAAEQIEVEAVTAREYAQACGAFYDLVDQAALRHLGTDELAFALQGAAQRPLGEAWAWKRKGSAVDISPLVAITLAAWGAQREGASVYEERGVLSFG